MRAIIASFLLSIGVTSFVCAGGCRPQDEAETEGPREEASLASYQEVLLDTAFTAASAMPIYPHIKNRSRAQEVVVLACLELDQAERARRYIEKISNWRRGAGYADLALHYARRGATDEVEPCLALAEQIAAEADEEWRRERIRGKIVAARAYLGQTRATPDQGVAAAEWGAVALAQAMACPADAFDDKMATLGKMTASEDFDVLRGALNACVELHKRFYHAPERRARTEKAIKSSWSTVPVFIRMDLLKGLMDAALAHGDQAKALALLDEAQTLMDSARWQPRFAIPLVASLAERRFRAGDEAGARAEAQSALELFEAKRKAIVNIYRAQMLRPIAEAYHVMGETETALDLYRQTVEAGMENPNSRPRADDLVATCCSMALHAVEPDAALADRIRQIGEGLGDPW